MYKLPKGIRIPKDIEYPKGYNIEEINRKRLEANIIEGYKIKLESDRKWIFSACINIDTDKLWNLFCQLCHGLLVHQKARGLIGFKETQSFVGKEYNVDEIIDVFNEYSYELINDGYIEFGIVDFKKPTFCEIFINNFKTIFIWGKELEIFLNIMNDFSLEEVKDLKLINDFPVASKALIEDGRTNYKQVIDRIKKLMKQS